MCYSNNLFAEHLRKLAMSSWELQFPGCVPVLCRTKVPPYLFLVAPVILSYQWPTSDVIDERTPAYSSCKVELVLDLSLGETPERISDGSGRNGSFLPALPRGGMWWRRRRRCASRYDITTRHQKLDPLKDFFLMQSWPGFIKATERLALYPIPCTDTIFAFSPVICRRHAG